MYDKNSDFYSTKLKRLCGNTRNRQQTLASIFLFSAVSKSQMTSNINKKSSEEEGERTRRKSNSQEKPNNTYELYNTAYVLVWTRLQKNRQI